MKPANLLVILSDQHNPRVLGCNGHPQVKTPNLDRLAARGTRFASAYTNCPICVPARASFATGRHVHQIRFWDNAIAYDGSIPSWGHRLMAQGHHVASIGKLHYAGGDPARNGFHEEITTMHIAQGLGDLAGLIRDELIVRNGARKLGPEAGPGDSSYQRYDRGITGEACRWLAREAPRHRDKPWVLYVGFVCPHPPFIAPPEFFQLYPPDGIPMPDRYARDEWPRHPYLDGLRRGRPHYEGFTGPDMVRRAIAAYYGLVSFMDHNVGQVLAAVESAGLAHSTRMIYASDHGENLGNRGLWAKSTLFDESAGIPLIVAGPEVPQGSVVRTPVSLVDGFPTILECVGARPAAADAGLPGHSLFSIANGATPDRAVLSEYHASASICGAFMIRRGRYKYIHYVGHAPMLFDMESDPYERVDLASDPRHRGVLADSEAELRRLLDPQAIDRLAHADQAAMVERTGGRDAILKRGAITYSPPPGLAPDLTPVEIEAQPGNKPPGLDT
ncbi:MAG: sulfatase-like hydrolase/transferase [Burkholderiales bacterium]|nr:sulfatase-like hydrolase/transferase [Burkholderiales bacterium]